MYSPLYWLYLTIMLRGYAILTQVVKIWLFRRVIDKLFRNVNLSERG